MNKLSYNRNLQNYERLKATQDINTHTVTMYTLLRDKKCFMVLDTVWCLACSSLEPTNWQMPDVLLAYAAPSITPTKGAMILKVLKAVYTAKQRAFACMVNGVSGCSNFLSTSYSRREFMSPAWEVWEGIGSVGIYNI